VWEKHFNNHINIAGSNGIVLVALDYFLDGEGKLAALSESDGKTLWEKPINYKFWLLSNTFQLPYAVIVSKNRIEALNPNTGEQVWKINVKNDSELDYNYFVLKDSRYWDNAKSNNLRWIYLNNFYLVDISKGKIRDIIKFDQGDKQTIDYRVLRVLNDEYAVINDLKYQKPSGFGLYSLDKHKVLWKKEAQFKSAVIEEDILYYYTDDKVSAVELKTGKEIWSAPFITQNEQKGWKKPVIIKDKLVIATFRGIFAFDKKSGEFLYRVSDFSVGEAEARFYENTFEMLTRIGDELYIGSDTGCFNKLKIE
jgi:outer membrane protein assembly factor BamB